jgi:hypothetical protein
MTRPPGRLLRLHLLSRRVPAVLILLAATAGVLRVVRPLTEAGSEFAQLLPLVLTVAAAGLVAAASRSPFGDAERPTHPLPALRLIQALLLVALGTAALGAARIGDDPVAAMRNVAGLTGLALCTAPLVGASLAWIAPLAYVIYCGGPIDVQQVSRWSWPALPSTDWPATLIALALLAAGLAVITVAGARDHRTDPP